MDGNRRAFEPPTSEQAAAHLGEMEHRLVEAVRRKRPARDVNRLHDQSLTFGQRMADRVAAAVGSWRFMIIQSLLLAAWIALNVSELIWKAWDPYPFILLNLALSFQAAYSSPIIMMSQNRQAAKDRLEAELDLQTDLKAEALIEELHGNIEDLRLAKWESLLAIQQQQIELLHNVVHHVTGADGQSPTPSGR
jgi:uncharacterized membrane protein